MSATEPRSPDYATPADQLQILGLLDELEEKRKAIGPGDGLVYRDDVVELARKAFRDLEASRERERLEKLAEPRAHLCLEAAGAGEFVYLNDLEGVDEGELLAMIDGPAPAGYQEAISPRSRSDDIAARAKLDIEIRRARIKLERLELAERHAQDQQRLAELDAEAKATTNGKRGKDDVA